MSQDSGNARLRILRIAPVGATSEPPMLPEPSLAGSLQLESCSDVYRGLAQILRADPARFAAVIVSLDAVGAKELAFFSIIARQRRGLRVFVQGRGALDARVAQAIERGASGVLDADAWRALIPTRSTAAPTPPTLIEAAAESPDDVPAPDAPPVESEPELSEKPARVPWLRYSDGPPRTAPMVRNPPAPAPPAPSTPRESDYEPLLTEEELEALMSDDISAIAPKPNPSWPRTDRENRGRP